MTLIIDVFRGSQAAAVKQARYDRLNGYGAGKSMKKTEVERLLRWMVLNKYLYEVGASRIMLTTSVRILVH